VDLSTPRYTELAVRYPTLPVARCHRAAPDSAFGALSRQLKRTNRGTAGIRLLFGQVHKHAEPGSHATGQKTETSNNLQFLGDVFTFRAELRRWGRGGGLLTG